MEDKKKNFFKKVSVKINEQLEIIKNNKALKKVRKDKQANVYMDLLPTNKAEKVEEYNNALDWAINENKRIKNIAITGPYGSGKSSVINSYIENNKKKKNKFLKISLAEFNEEQMMKKMVVEDSQQEQINNHLTDKQKLQLIEKSILEQIIYSVSFDKIPLSNFKRISKIKREQLYGYLVTLIGFILSGYLVYLEYKILNFQDTLMQYLKEPYFNLKNIISYVKHNKLSVIIICVFIITLVLIMKKIIELLLHGFKMGKIKFDNAEIEFSKNTDESIYNQFIDEILYFFESTQYNVVIFEDLDRFNYPMIFTHLREINILLNNYKNLKNKNIKFVYAIRDDMFINKDRTKFFDFIIPIIPYVDAFNSRQIILDRFKNIDIEKKPDDNLIKDITIYIDDMRLLTNIVNEYVIYYKQIKDREIIANKLFAIIIYKNLYPKDFAKLQYNKGEVKQIFDNKKNIIRKINEKIENNINSLSELIKCAQKEQIYKTEKELRAIFEIRWKESDNITQYSFNPNSQYQTSLRKNIQEIDNFKDNQYIYIYKNDSDTTVKKITLDEFLTIEGEYDNLFKLIEAQKIKNSTDINNKKVEIMKLKKQINAVRYSSLRELIENYGEMDIFEGIENKDILIYLIKNGYIDEEYRYYLSHFYIGAISEDDIRFLKSVKRNSERFNYGANIDNPNEILGEMTTENLQCNAALNYKLVEFFLDNLNDEGIKEKFLLYLHGIINNTNRNMDFIDKTCTYLSKLRSIYYRYEEDFIAALCNIYDGFWDEIVNDNLYLDLNQDYYFEKILCGCNKEIILMQNRNNNIKEYMINNSGLFKLIYDYIEGMGDYYFDEDDNELYEEIHNNIKKLEDIIKDMNIKFKVLDEAQVSYNNGDDRDVEYHFIIYIVNNDLYEINVDMLLYLYKFYVDNNERKEQLFNEKNYESILNLKNENIENYLERNIDEYISNVYLKLPDNTKESEENIIKLLSKEIKVENKQEIIKRCEAVITDISKIHNSLWKFIFENHKLKISFTNIMIYFMQFKKLDQCIVEQLNKESAYDELGKISKDIAIKYNVENNEYNQFIRYLYENEEFEENCYRIMIRGISENYSITDSMNINKENLSIMIEENKIKISLENYKNLNKNYNELWYEWFIKNINILIKNNIANNLSIEQIKIFLDEKKINKRKKLILININKTEVLKNINDKELVKDIFNLNTGALIQSLDKEIFNKLISSNNGIKRIYMFANMMENLEEEEIKLYLDILKQDEILYYSSDDNKVVLEKNKVNTYLYNKLYERKYINLKEENRFGYVINQ